jgi:hypothetical protein
VLGDYGSGWLSAVPPVLASGLTIAAAFSILAGIAFVVADRVFEDGTRATTHHAEARTSEGRRRVEIREYLDAIDEPYVEEHAVAGTTVAFYLPARDVAVTFDAHAYFRIERDHTGTAHRDDGEPTGRESADGSGTGAVLCEHEMHGFNLGGRLPFDVPSVAGAASLDVDRIVRSAYDALGLEPSAGVDAVRDAYRDRVKAVHPDHGGSEAEFKALRDAYTTAKAHAGNDSHSDARESTAAGSPSRTTDRRGARDGTRERGPRRTNATDRASSRGRTNSHSSADDERGETYRAR